MSSDVSAWGYHDRQLLFCRLENLEGYGMRSQALLDLTAPDETLELRTTSSSSQYGSIIYRILNSIYAVLLVFGEYYTGSERCPIALFNGTQQSHACSKMLGFINPQMEDW